MSLEHYWGNGFQDSVLNLELSIIVSFCADQCFLMIAHQGSLSNLHFEDVFLFQAFGGIMILGKLKCCLCPVL